MKENEDNLSKVSEESAFEEDEDEFFLENHFRVREELYHKVPSEKKEGPVEEEE